MPDVNSHYISRLLTKPWEDNPKTRLLHAFDVATKTIIREPSIKLFAVPDLHTPDTEQRLSRLVEDAIGKYKQRCLKGGTLVELDARAHNALFAMMIIQLQRTVEAKADRTPPMSLDQLLENPDGFMGAILGTLSSVLELVAINVPVEEICYPSTGFFFIPMKGEKPAQAMPLSPTSLVALVPRNTPVGWLEEIASLTGAISAFSAAPRGLLDKIVMPPNFHKLGEEGARRIEAMREHGQRLTNQFAAMWEREGLATYGFRE